MRIVRFFLGMACMVSPLSAEILGMATVTVPRAEIKLGPRVVGTVKEGTVLKISSVKGAWYGVHPARGWIHKIYIRYQPASGALSADAPKAPHNDVSWSTDADNSFSHSSTGGNSEVAAIGEFGRGGIAKAPQNDLSWSSSAAPPPAVAVATAPSNGLSWTSLSGDDSRSAASSEEDSSWRTSSLPGQGRKAAPSSQLEWSSSPMEANGTTTAPKNELGWSASPLAEAASP